ncbi:hybrid sensor histidine kinase/response regulator [bacterium]|nr:hybrid sensor histidine kinase/response regulator [bacterium]
MVIGILILFGVHAESRKKQLVDCQGRKNRPVYTPKIFLIGFGYIALYWILESVRDSYIFEKGNILHCIFNPGPMGIWMRLLSVFIIVLFTLYYQTLINERKKMEEQFKKEHNILNEHVEKLKEVDQMKSDFISVVSHEFRTPIAVMREGVSLYLDGLVGEVNDQQRELFTDIFRSINRLERMVTDLLDVSKIEAGKVKLRRGSVDMCNIVRTISKQFEPQIKEKDIQLIAELPTTELKIFADGDKVTQIFTNLISNAIRFTSKGGKIIIKVEDLDEIIQCSVSDTGVGISKQNLSKLFSKFEQFGKPEGKGDKGTGLGLAIAKGLVEKHGGTIWVESEVGIGTTFSFTLKKVPFPNILIVDDEPGIIQIIERFLSVDNYQFINAFNGKEAIERAMKENPSLIVLDMVLPEIDGYEVIRQLKENKHTHDIPILAMSAHSVDGEWLDHVDGKHGIPFLAKPIESDVLLNRVKDILSS